ncbi:enterochelin esterase domain-containing protein [Pollutimonas bauzanensis]|uniref:enterochelin esterase domain-containing protein n=1 Tax=Pollutimonas bauzanensis TaxID=658167 RepID=UPI003341C776
MSTAGWQRALVLTGCMVFGMAAWATGAGAQAAVPTVLAAGHSARGDVPVGGSYIFRLNVPAGHVVQGEFKGRNTVLDLQDEQGRHVRRLGVADGTQQGMMWVAADSPQRLAVHHTGDMAGTFELQLAKVLAPQIQRTSDDGRKLASPRLRALQKTIASGGSSEAFWKEIAREGSPLIESLSDKESLVTFLWKGEAKNVRLFGSPSGDHDPLARLPGSDVWWATFRMPNTARLSYRLAPDIPVVQDDPRAQRRIILATAQRDHLNPRVFPDTADTLIDIYQGASAVALPKAPPQPWIERNAGTAAGTLVHHELDSAILGNRRDVWIYQPAGAAPEALLVLFDAHAYLERVPTPAIIDNLMAEGLIPPTAVVLIGNPSPTARGVELPPNKLFARFLDEELMPWVKDRGVSQPAERTVIAGSSYGGLASAYAGLVNPHHFGNVLSLSGSYWWAPKGEIPGWMMREYVKASKADVRFYLDAGRYEASHGGRDGILETSRHLGDVLRAKGYAVTQVEHDTGHDYLHWQGSLGCGLVALLKPVAYESGLPACHGQ